LFSAIVITSIVRSLDELEPDYQQQTALLLYQLLNGGPNATLATISDPTIPRTPARLAVVVNCLWCTSLVISVGAGSYAMSLKWWLSEYNSGANPVGGLLRACQRHMRFRAFERLNVHTLIAFLPTLLLRAIDLYFAGGVIYFWQINRMVAIVCLIIGGIPITAYFLFIVFPAVTNLPFSQYPTLVSHRPSDPSIIRRASISAVGAFVRLCCLISHRVTDVFLFPGIQSISGTGTLQHWYAEPKKISPEEDEHMHLRRSTTLHDSPEEDERVPLRRATTLHNSLDDIDTSRKAQEDAIMWLSQVPLNPSESKALVSNLALIPPSRLCERFQKSIVGLANLVLETSLREETGKGQTDTAIDCVLVLGDIKFQSVVDRNSDRDHDVGGITVAPFVAWAAQQLTSNAFQPDFDTSHSEGIRERLLAAAAWLSPICGVQDVWNGEKLEIQDRSQFIKGIRTTLKRHVRNDKLLHNDVLIDLIHGMHACIPRGNYGSESSIVPFLSLFCEDSESSWSEDMAVLRALIMYALDLLLPRGRRRPLVDRKIAFNDLASELVGALKANTDHSDVVAFGFWLARRTPKAFRSRRTALTDIADIWFRTNETAPKDNPSEPSSPRATDAFIAVAQHHVVAHGRFPRLMDYTALKLLSAALEHGYNQSMSIYTMAMILNLGTSNQVVTATTGIEVGSITRALFSDRGDLESGGAGEAAIDTRIYSTLVLLKLSPTVELDVEKVKGLIVQMEEAIELDAEKAKGLVVQTQAIGDSSARDIEAARSSEADGSVDIDQERWKAIYLSALLFKFLPDDERETYVEGLWTKVKALLRSGGLSLVDDYRSCLKPLGVDVSELGTLAIDQQVEMRAVFQAWISGFPLLQLEGEANNPQPRRKRIRSSFFNPRRWFR
jgi:hypothetical protein